MDVEDDGYVFDPQDGVERVQRWIICNTGTLVGPTSLTTLAGTAFDDDQAPNGRAYDSLGGYVSGDDEEALLFSLLLLCALYVVISTLGRSLLSGGLDSPSGCVYLVS